MQQRSIPGVRQEGLHIQPCTWQVMWEHTPWSPELLGRSERAGERRRHNVFLGLFTSSPDHRHTPPTPHTPLLCLAVPISIYLQSYQYLQSSSVTPHSFSSPPLNMGAQKIIELKYTVAKCTQHPQLPPPISFLLKNIRTITTIMMDLLSATLEGS